MSDILISNLRKNFADETVFDGLDLVIKEGQVTCIRGRSGFGKTTLLRIMAGLEPADGGQISGIPDKIGFVFQEDRLCEDFSAVSNLRLVTGKGHEAEIRESLAELGLGDALEKPVRGFSGGMKRRTAIARAVCSHPDLLLLDEPFKGLDEALKRDVIDYVLRHTEGKTVVCVTHDPEEARLMGGRLIDLETLKSGRIADSRGIPENSKIMKEN